MSAAGCAAIWRRDRGHGPGRAEEPRVCGHRGGAAAERPVRRGRRGNHVRALRHVSAHLDGAELVARGGRGRRGGGHRRGRGAGGAAGRGDRAGDRAAVPAVRAPAAGMDRELPVEGRGHRIPRRSGHRRGHRGAAQAHRDVRRGRQRVARARVVAGLARRHALDDTARRRHGARGDPRAASPGARGSRCAGARGRRTAGLIAVRPRRARGGAGRRRAKRAARPGAARSRAGRGPLRDHRHRGCGVAADRVLPDRRRRQGVRRAASLPDRREPGIRGSGDGERGRGRVPGDAGVDQPLGQLAERVRGRTDAGRIARDRRPGARDAAVSRSAVLGPPEGRPRGRDHRRGRVRHDRRSPSCAGSIG